MKLDPRIEADKRPLTPFDAEETKQFVGKDCYFAHNHTSFRDLHLCGKGCLTAVDDRNDTPFYMADGFGGINKFPYIVLCEWVEEEKPEPKYRPYKDYNELYEDFSVGQIIAYKNKDCDSEHCAEIVEVFTNSGGDTFVGIGTTVRTLSGWFQTIEVKDPETNMWVPFGVKL